MRLPRFRAAVTALLLLVLAPAAQAGVVILGTRIVYEGGAKEKSIQLTNKGSTPVMVQSWIDTGDADAVPGALQVPFLLTPPLARMDRDKGQTLRLIYTPASAAPLPADRESVFYFNALEIPPAPEATEGRNLLQLAVRSRIKLFYRPVGLQGDPRAAAGTLTWQLGRDSAGSYLKVRNPSNYHVTLSKAELPGAKTTEGGMVAPQGQLRLPLAGNASAGPITWEWIDDYGSTVEATATLQAAAIAPATPKAPADTPAHPSKKD